MSADYQTQMPMNRSHLPSHKKTELSQILNPEAQAQVLRYPVLQEHVPEYQNYRSVDVGFGHPSQQWNSRNSGEGLASHRYATQYYNNGVMERWGTTAEYTVERAAISADRDYPNEGAPNVGPNAILNHNYHHQPMFSDPVQNSHSHLQLAERASPRILAQQFVTTNSSSQQSQGETLRKRISPSENASSSQPKKTKKPPTAAPSKRGFTKKKRSETAALQAQNAHLVPSVTYISGKSQETTPENRMRMLQAEDSSAFGAATLIPELQTARCMSSKYKPEDFPRCVSCTRRWAGDTCRFQGIRIFMKNEKKEVVGMGFANNQKAEKPAMDFPKKWNASLTDKDIQWTMRVTAKQVLPILLQERKHVDTQQIIYRPRECDVRATCDTCMTSLFCCSWMCRLCGRESCSDCYEEIVSLTSDPNVDLRDSGLPASPELEAQMASRLAAQHSLKEKQNHSKPFFLTCTKRAEHRAAEFTPVSRFCLRELDEAIRSMEAVLREEEQEESQATDENSETAELNSASSTASDSTGVSTPPDMNVPIQVLHAEKERSYPNANQYLEQQSYYEQPYRPYQHRAQDLHQPEPYVSQLQTAHAHLVSASSSDHQRAQMQYSSQEQYGAGASAHSQSQFSHYAYGRHSDSLPERSSPTQPQIPSPFIRTQLNPYSTTNALTSTPSAPPMLSQNLYQPPSHCSDIPLHAIPTYSFDALTTSVFQKIWKKGTPILVTEVGQRFRIRWTPEYFIKEYGDQSCLIIECQTDTNRRVTVSDFFAEFGKYADRENARDSAEGNPGNQDITPPTSNDEARVGCLCRKGEIWKLKDWPPSADFRTTFPELYEDFSQAVPIPNYVRRDGKLNIASHFPQNALAPDLGPKMYNAMASYQDHGSRGSTRLHMDMADALNVMTYAADCPDGSTGCAAWDLFRAEDSVKLRAYLKMKKLPGSSPMDPIHGQQVYLDEAMRKELAEEWGVYSFRVYQRPGEAVFIPAGCAHQVRNLADCIKVAIDFVSPENVQRCEQLTQEFREQNQSKVWKEDVLQLKTMMWFAWLSCSQQLEERKKIQMEGVLSIRDIHEDSD